MEMDKNQFFRDTWAEINLDKITYNVEAMKKHVQKGTKIMAVVKANAYGHGDLAIAKTALKAGAEYLAVATLDEAFALRKSGITAPILVLGASRPEHACFAAKENIALTIFQSDWLQKAKAYLDDCPSLRIHVKFDTGMGRIGITSQEEWAKIESVLMDDGLFTFEGIFTHFATADELETEYFSKQLQQFDEMLSWIKDLPPLIHASNSAAGLRFARAHFNVARLGIAMYGLTPSTEMEKVLPFPLNEAFSLHSKLIHVKRLNKGDKVSYGATYTAEQDEWIGTLPIGYADGWIRKLQGQEVLVNGQRVPIVGRICMDQCMVRLPYQMEVGTTVTLIGKQGDEIIPVNEIAAKLDTINYEVTCLISRRIPRVYKQEGSIIEIRNDVLL
ncbi:alanine racemase [Cytobacillus gottheilii]|uniref:Alanine racemase n=1 Tax=Cytobacillus gottheilii TaxID=859144 RepID=A0ABX8FDT0_9BACI|nr:alanine racemase [Cytobacillus gottheilii]QVY61916.1 alanine racemase [Cytobacillus gottheilii]